jgi:hypothetical protein
MFAKLIFRLLYAVRKNYLKLLFPKFHVSCFTDEIAHKTDLMNDTCRNGQQWFIFYCWLLHKRLL